MYSKPTATQKYQPGLFSHLNQHPIKIVFVRPYNTDISYEAIKSKFDLLKNDGLNIDVYTALTWKQVQILSNLEPIDFIVCTPSDPTKAFFADLFSRQINVNFEDISFDVVIGIGRNSFLVDITLADTIANAVEKIQSESISHQNNTP